MIIFESPEFIWSGFFIAFNTAVGIVTNTEYQLLALFMHNIGKVLTYHYILNSIWGSSNNENAQSLRVFIGSLRKKIEETPSRPAMIFTESGVGYRMKQIN